MTNLFQKNIKLTKNIINYKNISLARILNIVFGVMLIPFLLLSIWLHIDNNDTIRQHIDETMRRFTDNVTLMYITPQIDRITESFSLLNNDNTFANDGVDLADTSNPFIQSVLSVFNRSPYFSTLTLTGSNNDYLVLPELTHDNFIAEERPWFPHYGREGQIVYSDTYISAYSQQRGEDILNITAAMNIFNGNKKRISTVAYDLNMDYMASKFKELSSPYNSHVTITDSKGVYLVNDNSSKNLKQSVSPLWLKKAEYKKGYFHDKEQRVHVYYHIYPNPKWYVFSTISDKEYNSILDKSNKEFYIALSTCFAYYVFFAILCHSVCANILIKINMRLNGQNVAQKDINGGIFSIMHKIEENNENMSRVSQLANVDPLTALPNRRRLEAQFAEDIQNDIPIHLCLLDIDNFKKINDTYGHACGDDVLMYMGSPGKEITTEDTIVYRIGGEEFVVLFRNMTLEGSIIKMNVWRSLIAERTWREPELKVTFSGGLVTRSNESLADLLSKADVHLYQAKSAGKNRIITG